MASPSSHCDLRIDLIGLIVSSDEKKKQLAQRKSKSGSIIRIILDVTKTVKLCRRRGGTDANVTDAAAAETVVDTVKFSCLHLSVNDNLEARFEDRDAVHRCVFDMLCTAGVGPSTISNCALPISVAIWNQAEAIMAMPDVHSLKAVLGLDECCHVFRREEVEFAKRTWAAEDMVKHISANANANANTNAASSSFMLQLDAVNAFRHKFHATGSDPDTCAENRSVAYPVATYSIKLAFLGGWSGEIPAPCADST
ncbi:hypothetical protein ACLOJK_010105 [Asimina triloba]